MSGLRISQRCRTVREDQLHVKSMMQVHDEPIRFFQLDDHQHTRKWDSLHAQIKFLGVMHVLCKTTQHRVIKERHDICIATKGEYAATKRKGVMVPKAEIWKIKRAFGING